MPGYKNRLPFQVLQPGIFGRNSFSQDKRHCIFEKVYFIYPVPLLQKAVLTVFYHSPPKIETKSTRLILAGYSPKVTGKKSTR